MPNFLDLQYIFSEPFLENRGICRYELVYQVDHVIFNTLFSYIIPVIIMGILYGHMAFIAKRKVINKCPPSKSQILDGKENHAIIN